MVEKHKFDSNKYVSLLKSNTLPLLLIVLIIIGSMLSPFFISGNNFKSLLSDIAIFGLLAIGQSSVMLVNEIDLSVGSAMSFIPIASVYLGAKILNLMGKTMIIGGNYVVEGLFVIIILALFISTIVGIINGIIRVKAKVPSLIVTLGMMYVLGGFSYILSGGYALYLTNLNGATALDTVAFLNIPYSFLLFVFIGFGAALLLKYTKIGQRIYATGGYEKAAIYSGIRTNKWKIVAFAFCGFCAGLSSLVYSSRLQSIETIQGGGYELTAIAIAVIGGVTLEGGKGRIANVLIASAFLTILLNITTLLGLVSWYKTIIIGVIIIGAAAHHAQSRDSSILL